MDRAERRRRRKKYIKRREELFYLRPAGGTLYTKHVAKIYTNGAGYMAKHGTLKHYVQGFHVSRKTRDRKSYAGTNNWSYRDKKLGAGQSCPDEFNDW